MKKIIIIVALFCVALGSAFAQLNEPDPSLIGIDTAQQLLEEVSVSKFEDPALWNADISPDDGIASSRTFAGGPNEENGKQPIPNDQEPDEYVLGVRVDYFRRGNTTISISPVRPLPVPGIAKTISVWVAGRNYNHRLSVRVEDISGQRFNIPMGTMNFSGWRKLTAAIPPRVKQTDSHYGNQQGIQVLGFSINPALIETYGSYYVYFDDLRVWTDLFSENAIATPNDPPDDW